MPTSATAKTTRDPKTHLVMRTETWNLRNFALA